MKNVGLNLKNFCYICAVNHTSHIMKKLFLIIASFISTMSATAEVLPAKSLKSGKIYFIYDAHGDDGTSTAIDRDTNYRYAFRHDAGADGISGDHVKAATAVGQGRTFNATYAWRAVEVNGNWQFQNVGTGMYVTGGTNTGDTPATMVLESTATPTQFTLRMAGSANNRWDGDYNRTGVFWNYQYHYPFVWWEGEGHPYEFYEAILSGADTYAFAEHDCSQIGLISQRALELKNVGLISASAYSTASAAISCSNSNEEALEAFNEMLATVSSGHMVLDGKILTILSDHRLFVEYTNEYLPGTYRFTAALRNITAGTLRLNNSDIVLQMATAQEAAAEHLAGALDYAGEWSYSPEPGHVSISAETYAALNAATAAEGKSIAEQRAAADALFAADGTMAVNLPVVGKSYAINYKYTFGLTYNNYLCTDGREIDTARSPQAWLLSEQDGSYCLSAKGIRLSPVKLRPDDTPDSDGIYPFLIESGSESDSWGLAFEFHIMKTNVIFDSAPMPVYLTNMEADQSSIREIECDRAPVYYDLQGRRIAHPTRGIYITPTGKHVFTRY